MYLILIYIILIFLLLIYDKNIEGNEDKPKDVEITFIYPDNLYSNPDSNNITLKLKSNSTIQSIKSKLSNKEKSIPLDMIELIYNGVIMKDNESDDTMETRKNLKKLSDYNSPFSYKIDVNVKSSIHIDSLYGKSNDLYNKIDSGDKDISELYETYIKKFKKFYKKQEKIDKQLYSRKLYDLLNIKSEPLLKSYNNNHYLDDKLNNKLKEENKEDDQDDLIGPSGNIYSPDLYNRIIEIDDDDDDDDGDDDDDDDDDNDKKFCCNKPGINIEHQQILTYNSDLDISLFQRDDYYETSIIDYSAYNDPYYDYMKTGDKKYNYLYGSMKQVNNPGRISYSK
jgi:hypothetical protein